MALKVHHNLCRVISCAPPLQSYSMNLIGTSHRTDTEGYLTESVSDFLSAAHMATPSAPGLSSPRQEQLRPHEPSLLQFNCPVPLSNQLIHCPYVVCISFPSNLDSGSAVVWTRSSSEGKRFRKQAMKNHCVHNFKLLSDGLEDALPAIYQCASLLFLRFLLRIVTEDR